MASFDQYSEYDPQPDLDVDSWISNLESDNGVLHTPMTVDHDDDEAPSPTSPSHSLSFGKEIQKTVYVDDNVKPFVIRSCRMTRTQVVRRDPTPDSSDDDSAESVYQPSPKVQPIRLRRRQLKQEISEDGSVSPPLVSIETELETPSPSPRASNSTKAKPKPKPKAKPKRGGAGRKGEPRRTQNMVAQKKYRDKRVAASRLMSDTIVEFRIALESAKKSSRALATLGNVISRYLTKISELDPNLSTKQNQEVSDGHVKEEEA